MEFWIYKPLSKNILTPHFCQEAHMASLWLNQCRFWIFPHLLPHFWAPSSYLSELPMPTVNCSKAVRLITLHTKGCYILRGTSWKLCWPHYTGAASRESRESLASHNLFTWHHLFQREIWECDGKMRPGDPSYSSLSTLNELCSSD